MIIADMKKHTYKAEGSRPQLLTELSCILHYLYEEKVFDDEDIETMCATCRMTVDDLKKDVENRKEVQDNPILAQIIKDAQEGNEAAMDILKLIGGAL